MLLLWSGSLISLVGMGVKHTKDAADPEGRGIQSGGASPAFARVEWLRERRLARPDVCRRSRVSASGFQLRVHLTDESLAGGPDFLDLRIEIGGDLGRHHVVLALPLR